MESYPSAKSTIAQFLQPINDQLDAELQALISTLTTEILSSGLKYESLKEMSTDNRLTYISAQLLAISLCESLSKEMQKLELAGVNCLEKGKAPESRISYLKEILIKQIQQHTKTTH